MSNRSENKAATRRRIVAQAAASFRAKGEASASLPAIMEAAGLTVGGFYRHFDSKDALFRDALESSMDETVGRVRRARTAGGDPREALARAAVAYLSRSHRADVAGGCPVPALAAEVARRDPTTRRVFERSLTELIDEVEGAVRGTGVDDGARAQAWSTLATLVGGLLLARAVEEDGTADEILGACQQALLG